MRKTNYCSISARGAVGIANLYYILVVLADLLFFSLVNNATTVLPMPLKDIMKTVSMKKCRYIFMVDVKRCKSLVFYSLCCKKIIFLRLKTYSVRWNLSLGSILWKGFLKYFCWHNTVKLLKSLEAHHHVAFHSCILNYSHVRYTVLWATALA